MNVLIPSRVTGNPCGALTCGQAIASVLELVADLRCDSSDSEADTPPIRANGYLRAGVHAQVSQRCI